MTGKIVVFIFEIILQALMLFILTVIGNRVIKFGFRKINEKTIDEGNRLGRHIGTAERILLCFGIYFAQWDVVTAIIALKAIARFKKLDNKDFAEYFLIGSMWSLIYSMGFTYCYKRWIGFFEPTRMEFLRNLFP